MKFLSNMKNIEKKLKESAPTSCNHTAILIDYGDHVAVDNKFIPILASPYESMKIKILGTPILITRKQELATLNWACCFGNIHPRVRLDYYSLLDELKNNNIDWHDYVSRFLQIHSIKKSDFAEQWLWMEQQKYIIQDGEKIIAGRYFTIDRYKIPLLATPSAPMKMRVEGRTIYIKSATEQKLLNAFFSEKYPEIDVNRSLSEIYPPIKVNWVDFYSSFIELHNISVNATFFASAVVESRLRIDKRVKDIIKTEDKQTINYVAENSGLFSGIAFGVLGALFSVVVVVCKVLFEVNFFTLINLEYLIVGAAGLIMLYVDIDNNLSARKVAKQLGVYKEFVKKVNWRWLFLGLAIWMACVGWLYALFAQNSEHGRSMLTMSFVLGLVFLALQQRPTYNEKARREKGRPQDNNQI